MSVLATEQLIVWFWHSDRELSLQPSFPLAPTIVSPPRQAEAKDIASEMAEVQAMIAVFSPHSTHYFLSHSFLAARAGMGCNPQFESGKKPSHSRCTGPYRALEDTSTRANPLRKKPDQRRSHRQASPCSTWAPHCEPAAAMPCRNAGAHRPPLQSDESKKLLPGCHASNGEPHRVRRVEWRRSASPAPLKPARRVSPPSRRASEESSASARIRPDRRLHVGFCARLAAEIARFRQPPRVWAGPRSRAHGGSAPARHQDSVPARGGGRRLSARGVRWAGGPPAPLTQPFHLATSPCLHSSCSFCSS